MSVSVGSLPYNGTASSGDQNTDKSHSSVRDGTSYSHCPPWEVVYSRFITSWQFAPTSVWVENIFKITCARALGFSRFPKSFTFIFHLITHNNNNNLLPSLLWQASPFLSFLIGVNTVGMWYAGAPDKLQDCVPLIPHFSNWYLCFYLRRYFCADAWEMQMMKVD